MSRTRVEVPQLENMVATRKKKSYIKIKKHLTNS